MKALILVAACLFSMTCFGQTKLISHRSHSGTDADFRIALEGDLFDIANSNFGNPSAYIDKIDTVILKGKNKMIVFRKRYTEILGTNRIYNKRCVRDTVTIITAAQFFKANSIDSLKVEIRKVYRMSTLDTTHFIGFDDKFKKRRQQSNK